MSGNVKNLIIVLGIITIAFAGYFIYSQSNTSDIGFTSNEQLNENILANSRIFISRRQALDQIKLDFSIFESEQFRRLKSFSTPLVEPLKGKENPFSELIRPNQEGLDEIVILEASPYLEENSEEVEIIDEE